MGRPKPILRGRNVPVEAYVGNQKIANFETVKKFKVTQVATLHRDKYNGQNRAIGDKTVEGYDVSIDRNSVDGGLLRAVLANDAAREANLPVDPITIIFHMNRRDGVRESWRLVNLQTKIDLDVAGMDDPVGEMLEMQGDDLKQVI